MDYWRISLENILDECGITVTEEQLSELSGYIERAAEVRQDYEPPVERYIDDSDMKRCKKLEDIIQRLARRLNVTVSIEQKEITYYAPVGNSHMGTQREPI